MANSGGFKGGSGSSMGPTMHSFELEIDAGVVVGRKCMVSA